jgi:hypothetical protein
MLTSQPRARYEPPTHAGTHGTAAHVACWRAPAISLRFVTDSRAQRQPIDSRVSGPAHAHPPHTHTVLLLLLLLLLPRWPLGTSSARG